MPRTRTRTRTAARTVAALTLAACALPLTGCFDFACNDILIADSLTVELDAQPLDGEVWRLELAGDVEACTVVVEDRRATIEGGCGWSDPWVAFEEGQTVVRISQFTPNTVTLALSIDGAPAGESETDPRYRSTEYADSCSTTHEATVDFTVQRPS